MMSRETAMPNPVPFEKLIEPDPRNSMFVGPITTDSIQQLFRDWEVRETVPEDVRKQLEVAHKLFVYGYFVYEFYTLASFVSILAVESALVHRLNAYYSNKFEMAKKAQKTTATTYEGVRLLARKGWRFVDDPEFRGGLTSLIQWAGKKKLLNQWELYAHALPRIRASHAHPLFQSVLSIGMAHEMMVKAIELVNELFATP